MKNEITFFDRCIICSSTALVDLPKYSESHLVRCKKCELTFCKKIPSESELHAFYAKYAYGNRQYFSPITKARYEELLVFFEKYRNTGRILDIGCGSGFFLEVARSFGWEVYGTEFSPEAISLCKNKGIRMISGSIKGEEFPNNSFDVITSFEVIEHINDPLRELNAVRLMLRQGGVFYCTTPNFNSLSRLILGPSWNVIHYPEHLTYFTRKSLNYSFTQFSLKKKKLKTTGFSISRFNQSKGKKDHIMGEMSSDESFRQKAEQNLFFKFLKNIVNYFLIFLGLGDTLKALYIKK